MPDPVFFAPLRVPLIDQRTGLMSREWYLFFQALWIRTGGATAPSIDDLLQNSAEGIGNADTLALLFGSVDDLNQLPTVVADLREQVAVLTQEIQALKQGPVI